MAQPANGAAPSTSADAEKQALKRDGSSTVTPPAKSEAANADVDAAGAKTKPATAKGGGFKWLDKLPPWASRALRTPRSWKTLFRCWLAAWAASILILADKSLKALGNACVAFCGWSELF